MKYALRDLPYNHSAITFNFHLQWLNLCWHITRGYKTVHQCMLTSRFIAPFIPWGVSATGGKMRKQLLKDCNFLNNSPIFIIESSILIYLLSKKDCIQYISISKLFWIWWKILDTIILLQDVGPRCEQTHAAFEVGLSLDQVQGVYSGRSDVVGSSQVRLCHTCIIDVMV